MDNKLVQDRRKIRYLSEYTDSLIKEAIRTGMHNPEIEDELKDLITELKDLNHMIQPIRINTGIK